MNRREFLKYTFSICASIPLGNTVTYGSYLKGNAKSNLAGMTVIDAHAHPDHFQSTSSNDETSTLEKIKQLKMNASCFAGVGDSTSSAVSFEDLVNQLLYVKGLEGQGEVKIVRKYSNLPRTVRPPSNPPGAILAVEGATPLGEDLNKVDELYEYGVRIITLMHYQVNAFGDIMTAGPVNGGLTDIGKQMVERMMDLGIIVDVAHAHYNTLQGIAEIARTNGVPIIDSHTSLTGRENPYGTTRLRTLEEMEMVAETGGVVCTWPLAWWVDETHHRTTFSDWATENGKIAKQIGSNHIGLGTDGGGSLPELIEGYSSILDLTKLVDAMHGVGFSQSGVKAYMGGNLSKVIKKCIG